ncbi:hypothetical protein BABINDRAFT_145006 [Babjeviella inositovora NRRL Y-12698]|uniref:ENTH domain-containing protein n=1 Tax=Babjeviella inositovora NRRL Y-12698 TaxID=984486 RepID=A0A1E3QPD0_9ASCO|nr:uncharacterized protein BABINDRAFT_145006 [Babjeviella inositovora NRRL Y-12698]ODQ79566.1 hypothetical protein BABINDRAFT_145006 [Babjeviella inositovora NRRL Y-12698]
MPSFLRTIRNIPNSSVEVKLLNATSNDAWGPMSSQLDELAKLTYHAEAFRRVTKHLVKTLSAKTKYWRSIAKLLMVTHFCLQTGLDAFIQWARATVCIFVGLKRFNMESFTGDELEQAQQIQVKAASIVQLVENPEKLERMRAGFHQLRSELEKPGVYNLSKKEKVLRADTFFMEERCEVFERSSNTIHGRNSFYLEMNMSKQSGNFPQPWGLHPVEEVSEVIVLDRGSRPTPRSTSELIPVCGYQ